MRTFDFIGCYVGVVRLIPGAPLFHRHTLDEYDGDYRTSEARFLRLWPLRLAVVVGRWRPSGATRAERLERLVAARDIDLYTADGELDPRFERSARQAVADYADDPTEEWTILQAVGLDQ